MDSGLSLKKRKFNKIVQDIKNVKIQGAKNIALAATEAYNLIPTEYSRIKLLSIRPTEPMLKNVFRFLENHSYEEFLEHFSEAQEKINIHTLKLINNNEIIFTHCHSSTVISALIYAKNKKKKFEVYNTETRPLFQGRKTSTELRQAGIKTTMFVDSAVGVALSREQETKKVTKVFLGADALLNKGVVNKIGSEVVARLARQEKIPVYILADSWKFSNTDIKLEQRTIKEIWKKSRNSVNFRIKNPAFEFIPKKYITGIITDLGVMSYKEFIKKIRKINNF